jgi:hypothetical protein
MRKSIVQQGQSTATVTRKVGTKQKVTGDWRLSGRKVKIGGLGVRMGEGLWIKRAWMFSLYFSIVSCKVLCYVTIC